MGEIQVPEWEEKHPSFELRCWNGEGSKLKLWALGCLSVWKITLEEEMNVEGKDSFYIELCWTCVIKHSMEWYCAEDIVLINDLIFFLSEVK